MESFASVMAMYTVVSLVIYLVSFIVSIVMYVLQSLGMYTIAKRRGINNPWLAWVPYGSVWILGSIADDYQLKVNNAVKNRRKVLLALSIVIAALFLVILALYVYLIVMLVGSRGMEMMMGALLVLLLVGSALLVAAVINAVFQYICLYELYASCDPNNKTLYLILSIFVNCLISILIFICRNKDNGLYPAPRPVAYGYVPPQYQPPYGQQPAYGQPYQPQQPGYQPPTYQPPQEPGAQQ